MEKDKQKLNGLEYEVLRNQKHLSMLQNQMVSIEKNNIVFSNDEEIFDLEEEEDELSKELESMKFTIESLEFMRDSRKQLLLQIKKMYQEAGKDLKMTETRTNFFSHLTSKRKLKCEEYSKRVIRLNQLSNYRPQLNSEILGPKFANMLEDEISVFEESRAVNEIFRHEHLIELKNEKDYQQEKAKLLQKQKEEKDKGKQ